MLDFRGRRLIRAVANGAILERSAVTDGHPVIPARLLHTGENELDFWFVADIAPAGASIIRSHDPTDGSDYLYTLLVPSDANQLFPCFDQPDLKARVPLALTRRPAGRAVANGPVATADTARGRITTSFAETEPISTYLIAFAAGPWHRVSSTEGGRTINAYVRRSRAEEADLDTAARAQPARARLAGALLRPALPVREARLRARARRSPSAAWSTRAPSSTTRTASSSASRPRCRTGSGRRATIYHEVAHQWFGDLVTMRWFDDLWLKEGFATYMAAKALADAGAHGGRVEDLLPAQQAARPTRVDETAGTTPVWQELEQPRPGQEQLRRDRLQQGARRS